jgi:protein SCO1/2
MRSNTKLPIPKLPILAAGLLLALLLAGAALTSLARDDARPEAVSAREAARPETMRAGAFNPPHEAPEFALRGSDGSEVTLARYRGKVVLLSFGFTYCAAVCPTTLATLAQARSRLGEAADSVQVIFVTVDPERDNAAHMRDYLAAFDPGSSAPPATRTRWRRCDGNMASRRSGTAPGRTMRWPIPRRSS